MDKNTIFILSTPNCTSLYALCNFIRFGTITQNAEHTHCYDEYTLKRVLDNMGFEIVELSYIIPHGFIEGENLFRRVSRVLRHAIHVAFCRMQHKLGPVIFVKARLKLSNS